MDRPHPYLHFGAMIVTSMVVMFAVMYLNTSEVDHVEFSETRFLMTLLMGASMAIVMLAFMWSMYTNRRANVAIVAVAVVVFGGALGLVRSQITVGDVAYMRGMIPHHSIAVLTSEHADIDDVRVRALADDIIAAQCREIAEMHWLIDDILEHGQVTDPQRVGLRPVPAFDERC